MAQTPEGKIKDEVKVVIANVAHTYSFWPVQTGRGKTTLDCIGTRAWDGRSFAVETKRPGKRGDMTEQQQDTARSMLNARAAVFCIDDVGGEDCEMFQQWLAIGDKTDSDFARNLEMRIYASMRALVGFGPKEVQVPDAA